MQVEGRLHIDGVPQHNHVDDDAECVELVFLAFTVTLPQFATFAVEDGAGQGMATFSPVQLDQRAISGLWCWAKTALSPAQTRPRSGTFCS